MSNNTGLSISPLSKDEKTGKSRKKHIKRPLKSKNPKIVKLDVSVQARNSMYSSSNTKQPLKNEASQVSEDGTYYQLLQPIQDPPKPPSINYTIGNVLVTEILPNDSENEINDQPMQLTKPLSKQPTKEPGKKQCQYTIENVLVTEFLLEDDKKTHVTLGSSLSHLVHQKKVSEKNQLRGKNEVIKDLPADTFFSEFLTDSYNFAESTNSVVFEIDEKNQLDVKNSDKEKQNEGEIKQYQHKIVDLLLEDLEDESDRPNKQTIKKSEKENHEEIDNKINLTSKNHQKQPDTKQKNEQEEEVKVKSDLHLKKKDKQEEKDKNINQLSKQPTDAKQKDDKKEVNKKSDILLKQPNLEQKKKQEEENIKIDLSLEKQQQKQAEAKQKDEKLDKDESINESNLHSVKILNSHKLESEEMNTLKHSIVPLSVHKPSDQCQSFARHFKNDAEEEKEDIKLMMSETEEESDKAIRTQKFFLVFPQELTTSRDSEQSEKFESFKTPEKVELSLLDLEGFSESTANFEESAKSLNIKQLINSKNNQSEKIEPYKQLNDKVNPVKQNQAQNIKQFIVAKLKQPEINKITNKAANNVEPISIKQSEKIESNKPLNDTIIPSKTNQLQSIKQQTNTKLNQQEKEELNKPSSNSTNQEESTQSHNIKQLINTRLKQPEIAESNKQSNNSDNTKKSTQSLSNKDPANTKLKQQEKEELNKPSSNSTNKEESTQSHNIKQLINTRLKQPEKAESNNSSISVLVKKHKERAKSETRTYKHTLKETEEDLNPKSKSPQKEENQNQSRAKKAKSKFQVHPPKEKKTPHKSTYDPSIFYTPFDTEVEEKQLFESLLSEIETESEKAIKTEKFSLVFPQELVTTTDSEQIEKIDAPKSSIAFSIHQQTDKVTEYLLLDLDKNSGIIKPCETTHQAEIREKTMKQKQKQKQASNNSSQSILVHKPSGQPQSIPRQYRFPAEENIASKSKQQEKLDQLKAEKKSSLSLLDLEGGSELAATKEVEAQDSNNEKSMNAKLKSTDKQESPKVSINVNNSTKSTQPVDAKKLTEIKTKQPDKIEPHKVSINVNNSAKPVQPEDDKKPTETKQLNKIESHKVSINVNNSTKSAQLIDAKKPTEIKAKQPDKIEPHKISINANNSTKPAQLEDSKKPTEIKTNQPIKTEINNTPTNTKISGNPTQTFNIKQPEKSETPKASNNVKNIKKSTQPLDVKKTTEKEAKKPEKTEQSKTSPLHQTNQQKLQLQPETRICKPTIKEKETKQEPKEAKKEMKQNKNTVKETKTKSTYDPSIFYTPQKKSSRFADNSPIIKITVTLKDIGLEGLDSITPNKAVDIRKRHDEEKLKSTKLSGKSGPLEVIAKVDSPSNVMKLRPSTSTSDSKKDEKTNQKQINVNDSASKNQKNSEIKIMRTAKNTSKYNKSNSKNLDQEEKSPRRFHEVTANCLPPILY